MVRIKHGAALLITMMILIGAGCNIIKSESSITTNMLTPVTIKTEDGVTISGNISEAEDNTKWVLLLHMMPATKKSYEGFQGLLLEKGMASFAIDFRGHGDSRDGVGPKRLDYQKFSDEEHQQKIRDVEAAVLYLESTYGVKKSQIVIVGASIGANLAIQYGAAHSEIPGIVALSPGLNYKGVVTMSPVQSLTRDRYLYLVASKEDKYSAGTSEKLIERSLAQTEIRLFENAGHGTAMFEKEPEFVSELISWISARF